jgi:transcriptional regulator with XRE-family HTH domain
MKKHKVRHKKQYELLVDRINQLCKENDMSYYRLSNESDVPISTLMNIIDCSTKNPGIFTIIKLCNGFGISVKEFFNCEELENIIIDLEEL